MDHGIKSVYIAAPIVGISEDVKERIGQVIERIEYAFPGTDIYVPSKHGVPNAWGMSIDEWARCIFTMDLIAIDNSEWIVVCDYGRGGTAGTGWECGYAFAKGKKILVIHMKNDTDYSVMMQGCSSNHCTFNDFVYGLTDPREYFTLRGETAEVNIIYN